MTDTKTLKKFIKESGYKIEYLATNLGITRTALSMKVNNSTTFKVSEMYKLCDLLNIRGEDIKRIFFLSDCSQNGYAQSA